MIRDLLDIFSDLSILYFVFEHPINCFCLYCVIFFPFSKVFFHAQVDSFVNLFIKEFPAEPIIRVHCPLNIYIHFIPNPRRKYGLKLLWLILINAPLTSISLLFIYSQIVRHVNIVVEFFCWLFLLFLDNFLFNNFLYDLFLFWFLFIDVLNLDFI